MENKKVFLVLFIIVFLVGIYYFVFLYNPTLSRFEKTIQTQKAQYLSEIGTKPSSNLPFTAFRFLDDNNIDYEMVMGDTELGEFTYYVRNKEYDKLKPCEEYSPGVRLMCDKLFFEEVPGNYPNMPNYIEPKSFLDYFYLSYFAFLSENQSALPRFCGDVVAFRNMHEPESVCEWRIYNLLTKLCNFDLALEGKIASLQPTDLKNYLCYYAAYKDYKVSLGRV